MTRPLRIEFAGAIYHVMSRGNARQDVVLDNADRKKQRHPRSPHASKQATNTCNVPWRNWNEALANHYSSSDPNGTVGCGVRTYGEKTRADEQAASKALGIVETTTEAECMTLVRAQAGHAPERPWDPSRECHSGSTYDRRVISKGSFVRSLLFLRLIRVNPETQQFARFFTSHG